jgi:hypothetical protein
MELFHSSHWCSSVRTNGIPCEALGFVCIRFEVRADGYQILPLYFTQLLC